MFTLEQSPIRIQSRSRYDMPSNSIVILKEDERVSNPELVSQTNVSRIYTYKDAEKTSYNNAYPENMSLIDALRFIGFNNYFVAETDTVLFACAPDGVVMGAYRRYDKQGNEITSFNPEYVIKEIIDTVVDDVDRIREINGEVFVLNMMREVQNFGDKLHPYNDMCLIGQEIRQRAYQRRLDVLDGKNVLLKHDLDFGKMTKAEYDKELYEMTKEMADIMEGERMAIEDYVIETQSETYDRMQRNFSNNGGNMNM